MEEDGEQYFYCVFVDITDEKQLQQRVLNLYEKELSYFAEVSSAEGSIQGSLNVTQGRLETYVSTSEMAVAHIGDSYEDTIFSLERSAMDPEIRKRIGSTLEREKVLADYANGKTDYHFEFLRRSNTGSSFWESTKLRSFRNPESGDVLLFFYTIDITEQKLQEQLLKRIAKLDYDSITEVDVLQGTHRPVSIDGGGRNILPAEGGFQEELHRFADA